jgi:hypothetical protein
MKRLDWVRDIRGPTAQQLSLKMLLPRRMSQSDKFSKSSSEKAARLCNAISKLTALDFQ